MIINVEDHDEPEPIPCPTAKEVADILDSQWAPSDLVDRIKAQVIEWETSDEHQRQLAAWDEEERANEKAQMGENRAAMEAMAMEAMDLSEGEPDPDRADISVPRSRWIPKIGERVT